MLHLIAFGKISGDKYAYDYVVKDNEYKKLIQHKKEILQNVSPETRSMFTFHVIKTESINFVQIQKEDPYFEKARLYDDFDEFISAINANMALNSQDVASYILRKYPQVNDHRFAFHKILYYIYSDYLVKHKYPLFNARFVAFEKGPVEYDIYRMAKYEKERLLDNTSFELKVQFLSDRKEVMNLIDEDIKKYKEYYDKVWHDYRSSDASANLTHRDSTPWSIARAKGKNSSISNADIVKFHHLEVLQ